MIQSTVQFILSTRSTNRNNYEFMYFSQVTDELFRISFVRKKLVLLRKFKEFYPLPVFTDQCQHYYEQILLHIQHKQINHTSGGENIQGQRVSAPDRKNLFDYYLDWFSWSFYGTFQFISVQNYQRGIILHNITVTQFFEFSKLYAHYVRIASFNFQRFKIFPKASEIFILQLINNINIFQCIQQPHAHWVTMHNINIGMYGTGQLGEGDFICLPLSLPYNSPQPPLPKMVIHIKFS
eukprot:TRINITY_DN6880_c2_g1_i1.p1 TRINITY_DN6880_c2_g1~~TRINITY_DN6880_c2_g1_i1.p1  ORF type:complete len:237 (+),score=-8.33 TRINITY_DN6880_c2_g1_i1:295-1005(+)